MDKVRSIKNISVAIAFRVVLLFFALFTRRVLINYLGNDINGLDSLYTSLIGVLSVAELGVGTAISFCMYKPIVEENEAKIAGLYQLFEKTYRIIGAVVLVVGLCITPFIPMMAKDYLREKADIYATFVCMLVSVVLSYMFSAKTSLINAYKDNYITTAISSLGLILQQILQIIVIIITKSFFWYLICRIIVVLLQWFITGVIAKKRHEAVVIYTKTSLDKETKVQIIQNIKALFMHRIGSVLVNSISSIIISAFIGIVILGKYSNYTVIMSAMISVISLFFSPLTSIIGHMYVSEKDKLESYYKFFYSFNFILGVVFFLGYYAVIDDLISIMFGESLVLPKSISFAITVNNFILFMRQSTLLFRDATGTFYNDRWKPLFEGLINVTISIISVNLAIAFFDEEMGLIAVIASGIITSLTICHTVEPFVLYKYAFHLPLREHLIKNYVFVLIFVVALYVENFFLMTNDNVFTNLIANGFISLLISSIIVGTIIACNKHFRHYFKVIFIKKQKINSRHE